MLPAKHYYDQVPQIFYGLYNKIDYEEIRNRFVNEHLQDKIVNRKKGVKCMPLKPNIYSCFICLNCSKRLSLLLSYVQKSLI